MSHDALGDQPEEAGRLDGNAEAAPRHQVKVVKDVHVWLRISSADLYASALRRAHVSSVLLAEGGKQGIRIASERRRVSEAAREFVRSWMPGQ
jgi:hypothetical protein